MKSTKQVSIQSLQGVENTLLFPLYSRALDCTLDNPILNDKRSQEMLEKIDFDFNTISQYINEFAMLGHNLRSKFFDIKAKEFLQKYPDGSIVSLGSGLDDRFDRIDNGKCIFIDIDLPSVIEIRKQLLIENTRNKFIGTSILDYKWIDTIKSIYITCNQPLLILAEAVFMYLAKEHIIALINQIITTFPNSEIIFDIYSNFMIKQMKQQKGLVLYQSTFKWGVKNAHEIEKLIPQLRLVTEWNFFSSPETHKGRFKILRFIPAIKNMSKIAHYKSISN